MKKLNISYKSTLLTLLLGLLFIPWVQNKLQPVTLRPLAGAITQPEYQPFRVKSWFTGEYQEAKETFLNASFGFRSFFVRINNQISFSLFNKARANGVIIGKENYLFETNYIRAINGADFIGTDSTLHRFQRLQLVSDSLKAHGKDLIVVLAAGKGTFYREYIPDRLKKPKGKTNYELHTELARQSGLRVIDFNSWLLHEKTTSPYPLYPRYGIHWSTYAACRVADSLTRYIEHIRGIDIPGLMLGEVSREPAHGDDIDISEGMNLLFTLTPDTLGYPVLSFESDSGRVKPSLLVISDSYFWGMYNFGISRSFGECHFWFYNQQVYPETFTKQLTTSELNLKEQLMKHDVVVIMATEANLPNLGWGFVEKAARVFSPTPEEQQKADFDQKVKALTDYIKTDKAWLEAIRKKADAKNISLDSMVLLDAIYMVRNPGK